MRDEPPPDLVAWPTSRRVERECLFPEPCRAGVGSRHEVDRACVWRWYIPLPYREAIVVSDTTARLVRRRSRELTAWPRRLLEGRLRAA